MNKSILLLALLGGTATAAQAQTAIAAGTISIGGSLGYSSHTERDAANNAAGVTESTEKQYSKFNFSPSVGYFLRDNIAVGLQLSYLADRTPGPDSPGGSPKVTYTPAPKTTPLEADAPTTIKVGPYVQYYKMLSDQFGIVGTFGLGYVSKSSANVKVVAGDEVIQEKKGSGFYADVTPGIIFFPIPKFGISASIGGLGYSKVSNDYPTNSGTAPTAYEDKVSDFGLNFGLDQLNFGATYFLGR